MNDDTNMPATGDNPVQDPAVTGVTDTPPVVEPGVEGVTPEPTVEETPAGAPMEGGNEDGGTPPTTPPTM